jgi:hypothetical protein
MDDDRQTRSEDGGRKAAIARGERANGVSE